MKVIIEANQVVEADYICSNGTSGDLDLTVVRLPDGRRVCVQSPIIDGRVTPLICDEDNWDLCEPKKPSLCGPRYNGEVLRKGGCVRHLGVVIQQRADGECFCRFGVAESIESIVALIDAAAEQELADYNESLQLWWASKPSSRGEVYEAPNL